MPQFPVMRSVRRAALVVLVVVVGVAVSAAWPTTIAPIAGSDNPFYAAPTATAGSSAAATPGADAGSSTTVPGPPITPIAWAPCQRGLQCGSVTVPLDYADPASPTIAIAVARHPAEDPAARIGSIVINPGGPGGSGIDDLPSELSVLTAGLLQRFDIVSFDPRGVDRSAPVTCGETGGPATQGPLPDPDPPTAAGQQAVVQNDQSYAAQCAAASGLVLPFVGTVDTARDLDRIRQALGDSKLTYIGHSYGTLLGLTYADLFPTHVRAMVLDGVIDPSISAEQMVEDQAAGFESVLDDFFSWCASSSSCPWRPSGDPTVTLLGLIDQSRQTPLPAGGGRSAGPGEFY
ncbi:MAG TPA: alpha/beta fold hydrolase, partial [Acidimicrobiales bacterium]|nr:alpha/beta fold hydrolase [Acidimicrobiales bacterium]